MPALQLTCNLTTPELQLRKQTILADIKKLILTTEETTEGFQYKFAKADETIELLLEFIKTEAQCCDFFHYRIALDSSTDILSLELSGPEGVKEFIITELGL